MILVFDACMAKKVPRWLREHGLDVRMVNELLPHSAPDDYIFELIGMKRWALITCDHGVSIEGSPEQRALIDHSAACFVLRDMAQCSARRKLRAIVRHCAFMRDRLASEPHPFVFELPERGRPEQAELPAIVLHARQHRRRKQCKRR